MGKARDTLKLMVGRVAELAFPELGREIDEVRNAGRAPKLKRAILYARLRRAHALGDVAAMDDALSAFWKGGPGDKFHDNFAEERFRVFREQHAVVIEALAGLLEASGARFSRLVEIGCGDGKALADCVERLPSITEAIGLDINAAVIARASSEHPPGGRLSFAHADAREWLTANPQPGTVMLSNGGVLEYFSQDNVDRLFQALALARPAAIVLVEPAAPDHDLQSQAESFAFGHEYSFSHNHRGRLTQAGFDVVFEEETHAFGARLMLMIGLRK
ncbi:MAG TPA: class I SAM-dependent methyltransferase [Phenylobacterium sp.]|nr:class I SAM-dependent methyltransferase [Phenylobacterium sp.]